MDAPKIVIPYNLVDVEYCVFKLYYADKYIVMMGKTLFRQVEIIRDDLRKYFAGRRDYKDIYFNLYEYIYNNPNKKFRFEFLLTTENPYRLLQKCQLELDEGVGDTNCLNSNFVPYLSRMIQTPPIYLKKHYPYWINRGHYLNFRKWQYNRHFVAIK
jgi:hypothetical protein